MAPSGRVAGSGANFLDDDDNDDDADILGGICRRDGGGIRSDGDVDEFAMRNRCFCEEFVIVDFDDDAKEFADDDGVCWWWMVSRPVVVREYIEKRIRIVGIVANFSENPPTKTTAHSNSLPSVLISSAAAAVAMCNSSYSFMSK